MGCFLLLSACSKKSDVQQSTGDVLVKVGVQDSAESYSLQVVQLKGIEKLHEVSGDFARFFYSPGSIENQLTGTSPRARFIHTQNFFVPSDLISMQMATIYYHLQNLANFDRQIGAEGVNRWPRTVGIETQIVDGQQSGMQKNNAFYIGQTDSMMFVPYTNPDLPIAVNAGIIAHEHFHSLFFKLVILPAYQAQNISSSSASIHVEEEKMAPRERASVTAVTEVEKNQMFNEVVLRGMNEGLADFWGWVYTNDPEFMRWSLPLAQADRTLNLSASMEGVYKTKEKIIRKIDDEIQTSANLAGSLMAYSYEVGTPYARFLKRLSVLQATAKNIAINDSKKIVSQVVFGFLKELGDHMKTLQAKETVDPLSLFTYVARLANEKSLIDLDKESCDFLVKYLNEKVTDPAKISQCKESDSEKKGQKDSSFVVVKP